MSEVATPAELAKVVHLLGSDVSPFELVINRGKRDGIRKGQRFLVFGYGPELRDPDSGRNLGRVELVRGRGEVVHVQEEMATIRSIERHRAGPTKRRFRDVPGGVPGGISTLYGFDKRLIEEEFPPEAEEPFQDVILGDLAKPI